MIKNDINQMLENPARIAWACRRGMLELDLILNQFFKEAYANLNDDSKKCFISLLNSNDMELFSWLIGGNDAIPEELAPITQMIRKHARHRI